MVSPAPTPSTESIGRVVGCCVCGTWVQVKPLVWGMVPLSSLASVCVYCPLGHEMMMLVAVAGPDRRISSWRLVQERAVCHGMGLRVHGCGCSEIMIWRLRRAVAGLRGLCETGNIFSFGGGGAAFLLLDADPGASPAYCNLDVVADTMEFFRDTATGFMGLGSGCALVLLAMHLQGSLN